MKTNDEIITKFANEDRLADPYEDAFNETIKALMDEARSDALADFCKEVEETTKKKAYECGRYNSIVISVKDWNALKQKHGIKE